MAWSRNETSLLLDEYEKHPVLYDAKHDLYYNRGARTAALREILEEVKKVRPNTTIEMIKMKLNTLRTQFNKEMNILKNKMDSSKTNSYYHNVSLWCFTRMMFLKDHLLLTKKSNGNVPQLQEVVSTVVSPGGTTPTPDDTCSPPSGLVISNVIGGDDLLRTNISRSNVPQLQLPTKKEPSQENEVDFSENGESLHKVENIEHQEQELSNSASSNESDSFRNNKKRKRNEHITDTGSNLSNMVATKQIDDEWDVFTKFITSEIKTIKSERRKNRMKREIISLILKNQEEEEAEEEEFEMS